MQDWYTVYHGGTVYNVFGPIPKAPKPSAEIQTARGRTVKKPEPFVPEDSASDSGETLGSQDEAESDDESTDLSGFIVREGEEEPDESYKPSDESEPEASEGSEAESSEEAEPVEVREGPEGSRLISAGRAEAREASPDFFG